jgi:transcriptional regulator with XRE-family HTH domain
MQIRDRKKLARLMVIQGMSHRQLAEAAGWGSHSYLGRLLRGKVTTCSPEAAVRIAQTLGVPVDDLFLTRMSPNNGHNGPENGSAA